MFGRCQRPIGGCRHELPPGVSLFSERTLRSASKQTIRQECGVLNRKIVNTLGLSVLLSLDRRLGSQISVDAATDPKQT
jgi:hypothetical protein